MSTLKVEEIQHISNSNNAVSIASDSSVSLKHSGSAKLATSSTGVNITGTCTATEFSGSAASLTSLPAANLTGTLPALSAANLTSIPAANITGTLPAIDGSNLTNVGGGSLEFVSKTTISGGNTASQINFTGLDYGFIYKLVAKNITVNANGEPYIFFYYDGASTASTLTIIDYNILHNGITHTNHDAKSSIQVYTGGYEINNWEFMMELHTGYYGFFRGTGRPNGGRDYQPTFSFFQGNLDPSNYATKRISGISIRYANTSGVSRDFQNGTSIILYKYKES